MKPRIATAWLGGCSGCHMSFLDLDERLIDLADKIELVYSPIADIKTFPENVDVTLVEGAVTNSENEEMAHLIRKNSRLVIAFGDCATTGTSLRCVIPSRSKIFKGVRILNLPIRTRASLMSMLRFHNF